MFIEAQKELEVKVSNWVNKKEEKFQEIEGLKTSLSNEEIKIAKDLNLKVETIRKIDNYEFEKINFQSYLNTESQYNSLVIPEKILENFAKKYALKISTFHNYRGNVSEKMILEIDKIIKEHNLSEFDYKSRLIILIPYLHLNYELDYECNLFLRDADYYIQVYENKKDLNVLRIIYSLVFRNIIQIFIYFLLIFGFVLYLFLGFTSVFGMLQILNFFVSILLTDTFKNFPFAEEVIIK